MARGHGRILTSIWEDTDFLALDEREQRLYLFLISQPNLNHAGLLPLTLRRWSRKATGLTPAELETRLQALDTARFIVMDDDTEELLIRSFVRNDGVWKQPKVMGAMVSGAMEIESKTLRRALLAEMDRIPLDELSDDASKTRTGTGLSIRAQVAEHITTLRKAFAGTTPDPSGRGSRTPSATPSATPSDTPDEGGQEGSTRGRAGAQTRAAPSPLPSPLPPSPAPGPSPSLASDASPAALAPDEGERDIPAAAKAIANAYAAALDKPIPKYVAQIREEAADLLRAGHDPHHLTQAVQEMAAHGWRDISRHLAHRQPTQGPVLVALPGHGTPASKSTQQRAALAAAREQARREGKIS
ncbi:hypothetical protein KVH15_33395 [Streptomyces olivaceus]|uniref:hypothetical protein n=1 Tax=Streptomyces olivaceus TaxID=47716 RepID=UPI0021E1840F|nr:hypothetical protein [Streptomyces olivaceus]MBZ6085880.1 hypothetical protein [Streptomyces olivaceus]